MTAKSASYPILLVTLAAVALAAMAPFALGDESHHEGMFVGVKGGQIAFVDRYRITTHVYPMIAFVKVSRNGRESSLSELQRGDSIQVMTETRFRMEYVISVEAVSSDAPG